MIEEFEKKANRHHEYLYDKDNKIYLASYYFNGKPDDEWIGYYPNGNIRYKKYFVNGKREGKWSFFREDGSLKYESKYSDGYYIENSCIHH